MFNFRDIIIKKANKFSLLVSVLSRNNSFILADVDESKQFEFLREFEAKTGQRIEINNEGIFLRKQEGRVEKGKKQLRLFFNATPEEVEKLRNSGLFINESRGTIRKWHRGDYQYILDNVDMIYSLIKEQGFHLGENNNYNASLHETEEEKKLTKEYMSILDELQTLDPFSEEFKKLKSRKDSIVDTLRELETKRLTPVGASIVRRIRLADARPIKSMGPNFKMDLNRALEIHKTIGREGFFVILFNLFMKADKDNYEKLKSAFPQQALEFEKYKKFGMDPGDSDIVIGPEFK